MRHGGGWRDVYVCRSVDDLLLHYNASERLTMIVQEFIEWDQFIGASSSDARRPPMKYDPRERNISSSMSI